MTDCMRSGREYGECDVVLRLAEAQVLVHASDFGIADVPSVDEGKEVEQGQDREKTKIDGPQRSLDLLGVESRSLSGVLLMLQLGLLGHRNIISVSGLAGSRDYTHLGDTCDEGR